MTDEEILDSGMKILMDSMGVPDATRFFTLVNRQRLDYTKWQRDNLFVGMSIEEICDLGRKNNESAYEPELVAQ